MCGHTCVCVSVYLAESTGVLYRTDALEGSQAVGAGAAVFARLRFTLVNLVLAE